MATILLVEDERTVRHLLRSILEEAGHGVIEACDGADALAQYQSHQTDLILTDLMMPRKDGLAFISEVQRQFPHAKIAAMTSGDGALAPADEARLLGVSSVLRKPLDLEELLEVIQIELNEAVHSSGEHPPVPSRRTAVIQRD